ncbi:hypothetical protein K2173_023353 [Erythroxylum novogranatense]|uniref:H15 domain-containing protein n=1 Tax=Erythroxylum novogranatense TaxID=1862640 RepID=A0AAV8TVX6_9ROSI|nr:hypothetical protein K2173_023353 [Erythroxylum novogranatense]
MADNKESEVPPVVEQQPATEGAKPVKEKKPKAPKEKKSKQPKAASHPPYFQMIKEALLALNEKSGSSPYAIAKYMEEKHKAVLPANFKKILGLQLKNSAGRGKLVKIKASYKLSDAGKTEKELSTTRTTRSKTKSVNKPENPAKKPAKKVTAKKTKKSAPAKPKQPKSIKSPAAKRARKASAA